MLMGVKNFKSLLISTPKRIELNYELILVLGFGLGSHPGPRPNIYFFWWKSLMMVKTVRFRVFTAQVPVTGLHVPPFKHSP